MQALVVFESHWGNTAAVARAVAEGIGPGARAVPTSEATADLVAAADLVVAGAPLMAFGLPSERAIEGIRNDPKAPPAELDQPTLRSWLEGLTLPAGAAGRRAASFETKLRWSPGGATGAIEARLERACFRTIGRGEKFYVRGIHGPLRDGELDRARAWGAGLARVAG